MKFPKDFKFGAGSSAFQVEGAYDEDGKGLTVADINSFKKSDIQADTKVASDFYHHMEEDIDLMAELGLDMYRFSISWARIIPTGDGDINQKGIDFYNRLIDRLIEKNITPVVTLYHFDLPYDLVEKYYGWASRETIDAFVRYAKICFENFGDRVKNFQIINEQNLMIRVDERVNIYDKPYEEAEELRYQMDYHMSLAFARVAKLCHEMIEDSLVAPAISASLTYPSSPKPIDNFAAMMNDYIKTEYLIDTHVNGAYPAYFEKYLKDKNIKIRKEKGDSHILSDPLARPDYLAINYYRSLIGEFIGSNMTNPKGMRFEGDNEVDFNVYGYFKLMQNDCLEQSKYGASIDPKGLRIILNRYYNKYKLPLMITENGLGTKDTLQENGVVADIDRIAYLKEHLLALAKAIDDGVEMLGYSLWSFTDLLSSHQGFKKRYGLVYVDRDDMDIRTLNRIKKDSYYWYQNVIKTREV